MGLPLSAEARYRLTMSVVSISAIILDIPAQALPNDHRFSQAKAVVDPIMHIWVAGDANNFEIPLKGFEKLRRRDSVSNP